MRRTAHSDHDNALMPLEHQARAVRVNNLIVVQHVGQKGMV